MESRWTSKEQVTGKVTGKKQKLSPKEQRISQELEAESEPFFESGAARPDFIVKQGAVPLSS